MSKQRSRYDRGKKVRGVNKETGELGFWRKTQIAKTISKAEFERILAETLAKLEEE